MDTKCRFTPSPDIWRCPCPPATRNPANMTPSSNSFVAFSIAACAVSDTDTFIHSHDCSFRDDG